MTTAEQIDRLDRLVADRRVAVADRREQTRVRDELDRLYSEHERRHAGRRDVDAQREMVVRAKQLFSR